SRHRRGDDPPLRRRPGRGLRPEPDVHRGPDRGRRGPGARPGAVRGDRLRERPRAEPEPHRLQDPDPPGLAPRASDPRPAPEPGRALRGQGRRRAAQHRAAGRGGQRHRLGHRRAHHEPADHRGEDRPRRGRRLMAITTGLLLLPSFPPERLAPTAQLAERTGFDYLWLADERFFREVYSSLTLCALRTERIALGTCVTDPYSRHPALTALAIATLDEISGGRAVLGMGAGVSGFSELGIKRERPGVAMREAVELIRRLLTGEPVNYAGSTVRLEGGHLDGTPRRADVPVYIAPQRPVGCRAAGRVADGAIMQGCVAEPLFRFFKDTVARGAREAGRDP